MNALIGGNQRDLNHWHVSHITCKTASLQACNSYSEVELRLYKAACMLVRYFQVIGLTFHRGSVEANTISPAENDLRRCTDG